MNTGTFKIRIQGIDRTNEVVALFDVDLSGDDSFNNLMEDLIKDNGLELVREAALAAGVQGRVMRTLVLITNCRKAHSFR